MIISDGLGSRAAARLNHAISNGHISHAYIFEGDYTVDKTGFAVSFVKAVLCEHGGCGECIVCRRIENGNYEDLFVISPETSVKDEDIEKLQERLKNKPFAGDRNVAVIENADTMTRWAQNRLLKTLEEPPEGTVIILLADNIENFLPTILSRCAVYRLESTNKQIAAGITDKAAALEKMIYDDEPFYILKAYAEKLAKDKHEVMAVLDCLEKLYRDFIIKGSVKYSNSSIYSSISAIEEARRKILRNMNISYALKEMIIKIGG